PGRVSAAVRFFVGYDALDEPQIVQEQGVRGVLREPLLHGLRVASRRLAGQVAVQQEVEALVLEVHTLITGQAGPDPQTDLSYSSQAIRRQGTVGKVGLGVRTGLPRYKGVHLEDERLYLLLDRYLAGEATASDAKAVQEWLAEDPAHALLLDDLRLIKRVIADKEPHSGTDAAW